MEKKNRIQLENEFEGTDNWKLSNPSAKREIEGYASRTSIEAGEDIEIFFNTTATTISFSLYRMGWYKGLGGRLFIPKTETTGIQQQMPKTCKKTGLVECEWKNPITIKTDENWPSGVYVVKLEELKTHRQSYVIFVLKDPSAQCDILFQLPVTTYQAYNYWGGKSLYDWGSGSEKHWGHKYGVRANKVSFKRPYAKSNNPMAIHGVGAGEFFTNIQPVNTHFYPVNSAGWDYNMVRWLEKNGYNVAYISSLDTHDGSKQIYSSKVFLSHGHDEYWSAEMRSNVTSLKDYGINLAFFSANTMFWQIRFEKGLNGIENSTMICYKDKNLDPVKDDFCTVNFRDAPVSNPEASLIGVQYCIDPVDGDIIIENPEHQIFDGTGLKKGDRLEGLLGYEVDGICNDSPLNINVLTSATVKNKIHNNPKMAMSILYHKIILKIFGALSVKSGISIFGLKKVITALTFSCLFVLGIILYFNSIFLLMVLTTALFITLSALTIKETKKQNRDLVKFATSNMTTYTTEKSTRIFSTGTIQWSWGLDDFNVPQLRKSRKSQKADTITKNILSYLGVKPFKELEKAE